MWRTKDILEHIESHCLEPRIFVGESIRDDKRHLKILKKITYQRAGSGELRCDPKILKIITDIKKGIRETYKMSFTSMNFYNKNCKIDPETIGKFVNLNKNWVLSEH